MSGEKAMAVLAIIQQLIPEAKKISKAHGFVHKRAEAEINGIRGFLVWDFICRSLPLCLMTKPRPSGIDS